MLQAEGPGVKATFSHKLSLGPLVMLRMCFAAGCQQVVHMLGRSRAVHLVRPEARGQSLQTNLVYAIACVFLSGLAYHQPSPRWLGAGAVCNQRACLSGLGLAWAWVSHGADKVHVCIQVYVLIWPHGRAPMISNLCLARRSPPSCTYPSEITLPM